MKALAIIINIFLPGFGTLVVKKFVAAIFQIALFLIGAVLTATGIGAIFGIPMILVAWIWSIVTAANTPAQPVEIIVQQPKG